MKKVKKQAQRNVAARHRNTVQHEIKTGQRVSVQENDFTPYENPPLVRVALFKGGIIEVVKQQATFLVEVGAAAFVKGKRAR